MHAVSGAEQLFTHLGEYQTARVAEDPVSGATVDKSVAIIGQDSSGRVFYFASEDNVRAVNKSL